MELRGNTSNKLAFIIASSLLLVCSCGNPPEETKPPAKTPEKKNRVTAPDFNQDSAYAFTRQQVDFGPRVPGSEAHARCADFLAQKLKSFQWDVTIQNGSVTTFDNKVHTLKNIIASFKPQASDRVLLCAHWDSRPMADRDTKDKNKPVDGANDGASGVGVLLEIARLVNQAKPNIGIDIILFDIEDYGQPEESGFAEKENTWCLGSQYWGKAPHKPGYYARYGILLDMVGAKDATFGREMISENYAPGIVKKIWETADDLGYSNYFIPDRTGPITDDHYYINTLTAIPTVDIIHVNPKTNGFGSFHHTHADNMNVIDKNTLKAVGQTVLEVVYSEN